LSQEHQKIPKLDVTGSIPVARSKILTALFSGRDFRKEFDPSNVSVTDSAPKKLAMGVAGSST
jgi:hypothetical protein